jgi:hypothetical protein
MTAAIPNADELKKRILFTPLESKDALHDWIRLFLGLDVPDCIVDEQSTSSPMDAIWETYNRARLNDDPKYNFVLNYAARDSFKTLGASILEVLMMAHLGRSVAHMAAIEAQARKSQEYVKKFLRSSLLRDYVVGDNQRKVEICRFYDESTGISLTPREYDALMTPAEQGRYRQISNYVVIIVCTMAGANSEHVPFMVVDEVDVVANPKAYEEARAIPAPYEGKSPITLLTSTRKFSFGLVQKEIDRAEESGLLIKHWNIVDCTAACPPSRHLPDLPKIPIYRSDDTLRALSTAEYEDLASETQELYTRDEGYEGCLKNCKLFAVCKSRLATHQKSTSSLLKPIEHTQSLFRKFSPEMAKAQLLCWKPSSEGMIYPRFDRGVHMLTPAQIAEKITGDKYDPKMGKGQLIALLKTREVQWHAGMDWGYTHNFACVIGVRDGARMFVLDVIAQPELELGQKLELCETRLKPYNATIWPDPAYPSDIKTFKRNGYRMRDWDKYRGSVAGGIEVVRLKLWPTIGQPELFFLAGDEGCELLVKRMQAYHFIIDAAGRITEEPDDEDDDECDALRYMVMNVFAPKGKGPIAAKPEERNRLAMPQEQVQQQQVQQIHWNQMMQHAGMTVESVDPVTGETVDAVPKSKGKKGGIVWDLG